MTVSLSGSSKIDVTLPPSAFFGHACHSGSRKVCCGRNRPASVRTSHAPGASNIYQSRSSDTC
jgi:hypothetical protein